MPVCLSGLKGISSCRAMNKILMDMGAEFKKSQLSRKLKSMGLKRGVLTDTQVGPALVLKKVQFQQGHIVAFSWLFDLVCSFHNLVEGPCQANPLCTNCCVQIMQDLQTRPRLNVHSSERNSPVLGLASLIDCRLTFFKSILRKHVQTSQCKAICL